MSNVIRQSLTINKKKIDIDDMNNKTIRKRPVDIKLTFRVGTFSSRYILECWTRTRAFYNSEYPVCYYLGVTRTFFQLIYQEMSMYSSSV